MNFFDVLVSSTQDPRAGTQKSDLEALLGALLGGSPAAATAGDPLAGLAPNPLPKGFLDSDGHGDVDMADLVRLGSGFLR